MKRIRTKRPALFTPVVIPSQEETAQTQPGFESLGGLFFRRNKKTVRLLSKYGSTSVAATSADFAIFHVALTLLGSTPVMATVIGRAVGSVVAFLLHRSWVFKHSQNRDGSVLRLKYVMGIFIGMGLNAGGVWLLNSISDFEPWPARIATATTVWLFGFLFNKKIVFG